jgi:hypothetical protein
MFTRLTVNREAHRCQALCGAGICEIDTTPQSIEATFTGRHETFRYTKVGFIAVWIKACTNITSRLLQYTQG